MAGAAFDRIGSLKDHTQAKVKRFEHPLLTALFAYERNCVCVCVCLLTPREKRPLLDCKAPMCILQGVGGQCGKQYSP